MDEMWAPGHFTSREVQICQDCEKIVEVRQTAGGINPTTSVSSTMGFKQHRWENGESVQWKNDKQSTFRDAWTRVNCKDCKASFQHFYNSGRSMEYHRIKEGIPEICTPRENAS